MAGKDHIKASFDKIYELGNFSKNILIEIFGANKADIFGKERQNDESNDLNASEKKVIQKVLHYGDLTLDDTATLKLYEITLHSNVRIEQSKIGIQQYIRKNLLSGEGALVNFINPDNLNTWRLTLVASDAVLTDKGITNKKLNAKRYTFIVGKSEQNKTITDRFAELEKATRIILYPSENEKNAISLVNTFSVEKLSTAFFDEYTLHYKKFVTYLEISNFRKSVFDITQYPNATEKEKDIDNKPIRDFVKKMLGRIVFLYFVQKKGWLGASNTDYSDGSDNFIFQLFEKSGADENFYHWLSKLFFKTLNEQRINDDFKMPDNTSVKIPYLNGGLFDPEDYDNKRLTFTPTLFHSNDFEDVILTDKLFKKNDTNHRGFLDFLNAFNFTVHEDSPEDHTVAVDPEMLGHIFENLLEDNKDKGAFYTPKEIVHYMCQESLIEYLNTHLNPKADTDATKEIYKKQSTNLIIHANQYYEEDYVDIQDFVKNKTVNEYILKRAKEVNKYLDNVKICDPAIGSGAFPMGLLQEIFAIKELLAFETNSIWEPAKVKENIIQNSIYGVDIEKGAVDIARLRFWLSLIVNEEKPKALPNLDYKIVVGDSLLSKFGEQVIDIDWNIVDNSDFQKKIKKSIEELVNAKKDFFELKKDKSKAKLDIRTKTIDLLINILTFDKEKYFKEHSKTKSLFELTSKQQKEQVDFDNHIYGFDKAIKELATLKTNNEKFEFFDWKIDFAELLNENFSKDIGFDIVIGNPPYFNIQTLGAKSKYVEHVMKVYQDIWMDKSDILFYFIHKSINISKNTGQINFIISNAFLFSDKAQKLRNYILDNAPMNKIINFEKYNVFKSAMISTAIIHLNKNKNTEKTLACVLKESKLIFEDIMNNNSSFENVKLKKDKVFSLINSKIEEITNCIEKDTKQLGEIITIGKGMETAANDIFSSSLINESNFPKQFIKRRLNGISINKYYIDDSKNDNLLFFEDVESFDDLPNSIKNHLLENRAYLEIRATVKNEGRIWWRYSRPMHRELYHLDKIWCSYRAKNNCFAFDNSKNFIGLTNATVIFDTSTDINLKFLLCLLNSKVLEFKFKTIAKQTGGGVFEYLPNGLTKLPIKIADKNIQKLFVHISDFIIFLKKEEQTTDINKLFSNYFEQIIDGMVYELYFPKLLKQHNRTIIEHLGELPAFTDKMDDSQKIEIITTVFNRLNEKNHPVRVNLFYMNSIPEIKIIEGKKD